MYLKSGIEVSDTVDITRKVFHIITQDGEVVLCNIEDARNLIKENECFYASHFVGAYLVNISEKDII